MVDGPEKVSGFGRQIMSYKDITLLRILVKDIKRGISSEDLEKAMAEQGTMKKFAESKIAKRNTCYAKRNALNDFQRFVARKLIAKRERMVGKVMSEMKKAKIAQKKPTSARIQKMRKIQKARNYIFTQLNAKKAE